LAVGGWQLAVGSVTVNLHWNPSTVPGSRDKLSTVDSQPPTANRPRFSFRYFTKKLYFRSPINFFKQKQGNEQL